MDLCESKQINLGQGGMFSGMVVDKRKAIFEAVELNRKFPYSPDNPIFAGNKKRPFSDEFIYTRVEMERNAPGHDP